MVGGTGGGLRGDQPDGRERHRESGDIQPVDDTDSRARQQ
jgi:hypothetical protein